MLRSLQLVHRCLVGVGTHIQAVRLQTVQSFPHTLAHCNNTGSIDHQAHAFPSSINGTVRQVVSKRCGGSSTSSNSGEAGLRRRSGNRLLQAHCGQLHGSPHNNQLSAASFIRYTFSTSSQEETRQRMHETAQRKLLQYEFNTKTLGTVMDPYQRRVSVFKAGVLPHPGRTVRYILHHMRGVLQDEMSGLEARSKIPGYDRKLLLQQVADMYKRINEAQANYQLDQIKDLVDDRLFKRMRAQAEERRLGRWDKMSFQLVEDEDKPLSDNIKIVRGRTYKSDKQSPVIWLQFTFRICSQQRFAAYALSAQPGSPEKQATLVHGSPDELLDVEDYWVFEYKARERQGKVLQTWPGARWRLVGRLSV